MRARLPKTFAGQLLKRSQLPAKRHPVHERTELAVNIQPSKLGGKLGSCSGIHDPVRMMATNDTVEKSNEGDNSR